MHIPPLPTDHLIERIRLAAHQGEGRRRKVSAESIARGELPPVPEPMLPPPIAKSSVEPRLPGTPDFPLDVAASMLPRARSKITVSENTPEFLRPLRRNQGGFNSILLGAVERLVDATRQLQRQNQTLHERLMALEGWLKEAVGASGQQQDWMLAVQNRLEGITSARLAVLEERLAALEGQPHLPLEVDDPTPSEDKTSVVDGKATLP